MVIKTINIVALSTLFIATTALAAKKQMPTDPAALANNVQWALSCDNQPIMLGMTPDVVIKNCGKANKTRSSKDKKRQYLRYTPGDNAQNMKAKKLKNAKNTQVKLKFVDDKLVNISYELEQKDR